MSRALTPDPLRSVATAPSSTCLSAYEHPTLEDYGVDGSTGHAVNIHGDVVSFSDAQLLMLVFACLPVFSPLGTKLDSSMSIE